MVVMTGSNGDQMWTVGQAADLLGVSVRTLHYWEQRGLLSPTDRTWGNHRVFTQPDLDRARQILIYRATGMRLEQIAHVLTTGGSPADHLHRQRDLLIQKQDELRHMITALDTLLEDTMSNNNLTNQQISEILGDAGFPEYQAEAEDRWGSTDDWTASQQRTSQMSEQDWREVKARTEAVEESLADALRGGVEPTSSEAQALAEQHRDLLSVFFPVSHQKHVLIARGYTEDPRFTEHYDRREPGLAQWLRAAVEANASAYGVDVTNAQWE